MSRTVDDRVVSLEFDNKQFESNVSQTMSTLDKLKAKLNLGTSAKAFENIGTAAKNVDLSGIDSGIGTIQAKFSTLQMVAVNVLSNIAQTAINAGTRIVKALNLDPIMMGFQEYETQIGAIQTILSNTRSKGSTLEDVNSALDDLNRYADQTIYNFTQMTRNIGTFTAAGVDLETATTSIKGIANLAAVSGSTSQQASVAMYQLSQALAAGRVSLMDWNSVVNAGMGGELFQNALKRTARNMGYNVDALIEKYGSFRESLTSGQWLTTEVLTETLTQISGAYTEADLLAKGYTKEQAKQIIDLANDAVSAATDVKTFTQLIDTTKEALQSGWTNSWEIIIGDYEEAKELFTGISEALNGMIVGSADARNQFLQGGLSSGYKQLLNEGITDEGLFSEKLQKVAKDNGVAIEDLISKAGSLEKSFKEGWLTSDILTESLNEYVGTILNMSAEERKANKITQSTIDTVTELKEKLDDGTLSVDEFVKKINQPSGRENIIQGLTNALNFLGQIIQPIKEAFAEIFPAMTSDQLYELTERFLSFTEKLTLSEDAAKNLHNTFKGLFSVIKLFTDAIGTIVGGVGKVIGSLFGFSGGVLELTGSFGDFLTKLTETIRQSNILQKVVDTVVNALTGFIDQFSQLGNVIADIVSGADPLNGVIQLINALVENFNKLNFDNVTALIGSGGLFSIFTGLNKILSNAGDAFKDFGGITGILYEIRDCLSSYQDYIQAGTLEKIARAVAILAAAIFILGTLDDAALTRSLQAVALAMVGFIVTLRYITKLAEGLNAGKGLKAFTGAAKVISMMTALATSLLIMAGALKIISTIDSEKIFVSLAALGTMMAELSIFLKFTKPTQTMGSATALVVLAGAMVIMAQALKMFGQMDETTMLKGLLTLAGVLAGIGIFMNKISGSLFALDSKSMISAAVSMVIMASSLLIFAKATEAFGSMNGESLAEGLLSMAVALGTMVLAMKYLPKDMANSAAGILLISTSMLILAKAFGTIGAMSWGSIAKGLLSLIATLSTMVLALTGLSMNKGSVTKTAGAILILSGAIALLTPALKSLGSMSIETLVMSIVALASAFAVIGAAGLLLGPIAPGILAVSGAIALLGVGIFAIGAGVSAFAAGLIALAGAGVTAAGSIVASLNIIITGFISLIPAIAGALAKGIVEILVVLADSASTIAESLLKMITAVLGSLKTYLPQIADFIFDLIIQLIQTLTNRIPELVNTIVGFLSALFSSIADAFGGLTLDDILKGTLIIGAITALIAGMSAVAGMIPGAMATVLGIGVLVAELSLVLAALGALNQIPGLDWLITEGGNLMEKVGTAIGQFIGGIVGGFMGGISSSFPKIADDLSKFMTNLQPFIDGAKQLDPTLVSGVKGLAETILILTAADVIDGIAKFFGGGVDLAGFATQLVPLGEGLVDFSDAITDLDPDKVGKASQAAKSLGELAALLGNEGGLISVFTGNSVSLSTFADNIEDFGEGLAAYSLAVADVEPDVVQTTANAAKALAELSTSLGTEGGLLSIFTGDTITLSTFAENIKAFGAGLASYYGSVTAIKNPEVISKSATAAKTLVDLAKEAPENAPFWGVFGGQKQDLTYLSSNLENLGKGLLNYSETVSGITNIDTINKTLSAFRNLVFVVDATAEADTSNVGNFVEAINTLATIDVTSFINTWKDGAAEQMTTIGKTIATSLTTGFKMDSEGLSAAIISTVSGVVEDLRQEYADYKAVGIKLALEIKDGFNENKESLKTAIGEAIDSAVTKIREYYTSFYEAGNYLVQGLTSGINRNAYKAAQAVASMAVSCVIALRENLGEDSPSKIAEEAGHYFGSPFVEAVASYADSAYDAGSSVGIYARNGLSKAVDTVSSFVDGNLDMTPTIRPVVDLSDVSNGALAINRMLGSTPNLGAINAVSAISSSMNSRQNVNNADLLSAIKTLGKSLSNQPSNTYNVNGVTYNDGDIGDAIRTLVRATTMEGRS